MNDYSKIPIELKQMNHWVCWGAEGENPKIPYNPITGYKAKANDMGTWTTFEKAHKAVSEGRYEGIGFEFADGVVGVDLDHCIEDGKISPAAQYVTNRFDSYTEISQSGTGIHILCRGKLPGNAIKTQEIELYDTGRYFALTGNVYENRVELKDAQAAIDELYATLTEQRTKPAEKPTQAATPSLSLQDNEVIDIAMKSKSGGLFGELLSGQWESRYSSQSEADIAFCNMLAFFCGKNAEQMDRIFRSSGLMREKWDREQAGTTYGAITIQRAIEGVKDVYSPQVKQTDVFGRTEYNQKSSPPKLKHVSAADLQNMELPPVQFIIKGLLPVGLGLLVSPPKYGKSWMVLDMGISVASGNSFLGHETNHGGCLYLALEDSLNRLKDRMGKVLGSEAAPACFDYAVEALDLSHGLLEQLAGYLTEKPETKLIIIDTLQKVRGQTGGKENAYTTDYREMGLLKTFADQHRICILLVHHLRKMGDDGDPFNRISGTAAIFGAADVAMVLSRDKRGDSQTTFTFEGRDIESGSSVLEFDKKLFRWRLLGDSDWLAEERARLAYQNDLIVRTIKKLLEQRPEGWTGTSRELLDAGKELLNAYIAASPNEITKKLAQLDKALFEYDGITHTSPGNGNATKRHKFTLPVEHEYSQTTVLPI